MSEPVPLTKPLPLDDIGGAQAVIETYLAAGSLADLPGKLGVPRSTFYSKIFRQIPELKAVQQLALIKRIAEADEALAAADTKLDLTRAIAQAKLSRFDYEKLQPGEYGRKEVHVQATHVAVITPWHGPSKPSQAADISVEYTVESEQEQPPGGFAAGTPG